MTGVLNVDTIADNAGTGPVTLTKQSAAKAWLSMVTETSNSVSDSFNIASNTDNGNGDFSISFSNSFTNAHYTTSGTSSPGSSTTPYFLNPNRNGSSGTTVNPTSSTQRFNTTVANAADDTDKVYVAEHGDLA